MCELGLAVAKVYPHARLLLSVGLEQYTLSWWIPSHHIYDIYMLSSLLVCHFWGQQLPCQLPPFPEFPVLSPIPPLACFWISIATCSWSSFICCTCSISIWAVVCCAPVPYCVSQGPICCPANLFLWLCLLALTFVFQWLGLFYHHHPKNWFPYLSE